MNSTFGQGHAHAPPECAFKAAKVRVGHAVIDVSILDRSETAARIAVPHAVEIAGEFELIVPAENTRQRCRVIWRRGDQLALAFMGEAQRAPVAPRPAVETPAPQTLANFDKFQIRPDFRLRFERHPLSSERGTCLVEMLITNQGPIDAHQPFLCLPILGLRLQPTLGWAMQEVSAVRRMLRFGQVKPAHIAPGEQVHCCTIAMQFGTGQGGFLEYEAGNIHAFDALPDLRLTCVAGAGNYPSERLPFIVPAAAFRDYLVQLALLGEIPALSGAVTSQAGSGQRH